MLAETQVGLKGLRALFEFYLKYRGIDAQKLAEELGYKVGLVDFSGLGVGKIVRGTDMLLVPSRRPLPLQSLIIYHETGHDCLWKTDAFFFNENLGKDRANLREVEYWLDSFAVAALFANRGVPLLTEDNYKEFLTYGCDISFLEGANWRFDDRKDKLQGRRIQELSAKYFRRRGPSRLEFDALGQMLRDVKHDRNDK